MTEMLIHPDIESTALFPSDDSYLPAPFAGETIYSWCAKFHRINSNPSARLTSRRLFGNSTAGFRHDFPNYLDRFSENTGRLLGSTDEIIYGRTALAIFAAFLPAGTTRMIVHEMCVGGHSKTKHDLGMLTSRTGVIAPLKACPACIDEDVISSRTGIAWWHVEHQWPSVRLCPKHGEYLLMAGEEFHGRLLQDWYLPGDLEVSDWRAIPMLENDTRNRLARLTDWSLFLAQYCRNPFDGELLRLVYHLRSKSHGWTAMDGTLKFSKMKSVFREKYGCLEELPGMSFIADTSCEHGGFIGSLLRQFAGNKHPLKHVLMLDFLFEDTESFIAEYQRVHQASRCGEIAEIWEELTDSRNRLKFLVSDAGFSINSAARQLGIPIGQAVRFLKKEGVEYNRRPRVLDPEKETELQSLLKSGEEREVISTKLGIKKTFIKDYLRQHGELRKIWQEAHHKRLLEQYRAHYLELLKNHQGLTLKQMRQIPGNGIQWLLRHDKEWLAGRLASLWEETESD